MYYKFISLLTFIIPAVPAGPTPYRPAIGLPAQELNIGNLDASACDEWHISHFNPWHHEAECGYDHSWYAPSSPYLLTFHPDLIRIARHPQLSTFAKSTRPWQVFDRESSIGWDGMY